MTSPWPAGLAISEGLVNALSGRRLAVVVVTAVALITGSAGLANALEVAALVRAEQQWIDDGAFVFVAEPGTAADGAGIDVATCDRLAQVDGIAAAFAVTVTDTTAEPMNAPGTQATLAMVSPGAYEFLGAGGSPGANMLVTPPIASTTGLVDGERTRFTVTPLGRASVDTVIDATTVLVDDGVLAEQLVGAYLLPGSLSGTADQCYVRTDAAHVDDISAYLSTALAADDGTTAIVRPRLADNSYGLDFSTAYSDRILGWAWAGGAAVLIATWAIVQWARRARWAIYATFGAHPRARLILQSAEWLALSAMGSAWGWGIASALAIGLGVDIRIAFVQVSAQVLATWWVASVGVAVIGLVPVGTLMDALKDRS